MLLSIKPDKKGGFGDLLTLESLENILKTVVHDM